MENTQQSLLQQTPPTPQPQKTFKVSIKSILIIGILIISLSAFALLTKMAIIPNYFDIEILCPFGKEKTLNSEVRKDILNGNGGKSINFDGKSSGTQFQLYKPVIYLYPETEQDVQVQLDFQGPLIADFPKYNPQIKGWKVSASPDGTLFNYEDSREYSYLFWEGLPEKKIDWDLSEGFVVKGEDTREFLQEKLAFMGLTPEEYNEFIVYWYPLMQNNLYNLIHFADTQYTETAPLTITPTPDSILRVFMVYKPLQEKISLKEQTLTPFERKGFTVIEWGGTQAK